MLLGEIPLYGVKGFIVVPAHEEMSTAPSACASLSRACPPRYAIENHLDGRRERDFFIKNLLVRIHQIVVMISRTGLAPWKVEFPFPGRLTSPFLVN